MVKNLQLKNGLKVLLVQTKKAPVVSVQCWVKTGSADERKKEEGISHFIEHLVFKGSSEYKTGEIAQVIEGSGGQLNAYTSFDQTVFYVTISKAFAETGLHTIREMMGHPTFDVTEIDNEREVVVEEIKRGQDSPHRRASQALFSTVFKKHPYGIPVIGYDTVVKNVSRKVLTNYYADRYSPANMTLLVVGDFEDREMKKQVEKYFGGIKKTKVRKVIRKKEALQKTPRFQIEKTKFKQAQLYISWPGVKAKSKDAALLDIFSLCLGQGDSSHLVKKLRNEMRLVQSIGISSYSPKDDGLIAVSVMMPPENLKKTLDAILNEIESFLTNPVDKEELIKAARSMESERFYSLETVDGISSLVGGADFYFGDYKKMDEILKQIDKITAADLIKVGRKYLNPDRMNFIYMSESAGKKDEKTLKDFQKEFKKRMAAIKKKPVKKSTAPKRPKIKWSLKNLGQIKPHPELIKLPGGAKLLLLKTKDSPIISVKQAFLGGMRAEPSKVAGVNELLSRTWAAGTKTRSEEKLNAEIEFLATYISAFGGRNTAGLSMTTLSAFADPAFEIFQDIFLNPSFEPTTIAREKVFMGEQLKNRDDNPARICVLNMMAELYGDHPYHRDPLGLKETVEPLTDKDVRDHFSRIRKQENLAFSVVGDFDRSVWIEHFEELAKQTPKESAEWPPIEHYTLKQDRKVFVEQQKEQSHMCLAYPGLKISDNRRLALDVMQSVLSGMGGRLFNELREKASLAYSVSAMRMDGLDGGYFGAYIGCSPEKVKKALDMMKVELDKLCQTKVPDEEIARAKRSIIGRHDIGLQKNSTIANDMLLNELYDIPFDEYLSYSEKVAEVTADEIQSLAQDLFKQNTVLSIVGSEDI